MPELQEALSDSFPTGREATELASGWIPASVDLPKDEPTGTVDGTPIAGILGKFDAETVAEEHAKQLAEEAEEARREALRTLYENVVLLDDHRPRRKHNGKRTTL
jgi:hypothetical protein